MIGLALVTFISVLANGIKGSNRDAIERQVEAQYLLTSTDGFTPFAAGAWRCDRGVTSGDRCLERSRGAGQAVGLVGRPDRDRPRDDHAGLQVRVGRRVRPDDPGPLRNGAIVEKQFAEDENLRSTTRSTCSLPTGTSAAHRARHLRSAALLPAARESEHPPVALRRALPAARECLHVPEHATAGRPIR